jgi:iron complex transport system ATP-binding protein
VRTATGGRTAAVVAPEPEAALAGRLLTREGWAVVDGGAAVTVTLSGPGRFTVEEGGGAPLELTGWAELAAWARRAASGCSKATFTQ